MPDPLAPPAYRAIAWLMLGLGLPLLGLCGAVVFIVVSPDLDAARRDYALARDGGSTSRPGVLRDSRDAECTRADAG